MTICVYLSVTGPLWDLIQVLQQILLLLLKELLSVRIEVCSYRLVIE